MFYSVYDQKITNLIFKSSPNNNRSYQGTVLCFTVSQEYVWNSAFIRYTFQTARFGVWTDMPEKAQNKVQNETNTAVKDICNKQL